MAHFHQVAVKVELSPVPTNDTRVGISTSSVPLQQVGFNMPVSISTPSSMNDADPEIEVQSRTVMAHFDTGASVTSIDAKLAQLLRLVPVGMSTTHTAAGPRETPNYAVDISFPGSKLAPFNNLPISSCDLPFVIRETGEIDMIPQNIGLLIGRDIMSKWNVVWNGPTSTVFISD